MSEHLERRAPDTGRVPVETLVEICGNEPGIPAFEAETVDVSARGMHLRTAYLPDQGAPLVCRFEDHGREIVVEGVVAWRREGARGGEFGVEFTALDGRSVHALRELCMSGDSAAGNGEADPEHVTGSRVRLHIEGLGSPMKARVRGADPRRVQVGSNLEFLKVGRKLEIEDLERGGRRTAQIDAVSVAIDPQTQVPQLVVALRFEGSEESTPEPTVADTSREGAGQAFSIPVESVTTDVAVDSPGAPEAMAPPSQPEGTAEAAPASEVEDDADAQALRGRLGVAATNAGEAAKVASAKLANFSTRATKSLGELFKGASAKVVELAQKRDAKKAPRRQTASMAPVSVEKQRLRPQSHAPAAEGDAPVRALGALRAMPKKKLAILAGGGVLALSVAAFAMRSSAPPPGAVAAPEGSVTAMVAASPQAFPAAAPPAAPGEAVTANVPLFGPTPMATMEPVPLAAPPQSEEAAERADAEASEAPDEAFPDEGGSSKSQKADKSSSKSKPEDVAPWGRGKLSMPIIHRLRLDAAASSIQGVQQPTGFMVVLPGRKLMEQAGPIAKRDARFANVRSVNTPNGAQITFNFKESVPAYRVRLRRDYVEFLISAESKSAKAAPAKTKAAVAKPAKKH